MQSHRLGSAARIAILIVALGALLALRVRPARAQDAGTTTTLSSDQFTLALQRLDASSKMVPLDSAALGTYFNRTRCLCPTNVVATLSINAAGLAALGNRTVEASLQVGSDCDRSTAGTCKTVGKTLTLSAQKTSTLDSLTTSDLFAAVTGAACTALPNTSSRLWAIIRVAGGLTGATPYLAFNVGGREPVAPTRVTADSANQGLQVAWLTPLDTSNVAGYQVLCAPGLEAPAAPAYAGHCSEATVSNNADAGAASSVDGVGDASDGGAAPPPLLALDDDAVCSGLVAADRHTVRIGGLENGRPYRIAVVTVGNDGTPSALSASIVATPAVTVGFEELYKQAGGSAEAGCAVAPAGAGGVGAVILLAAVAAGLVWSRRRRRLAPALAVVLGLGVWSSAAKAGLLGEEDSLSDWRRPVVAASPRLWNLELRFGPYRPAVDSEFSQRGDDAAPFARIFGNDRHLLAALELDRHIARWGGTWALGFSAGHYRVTGAALTADLKKRSGDTSALRLIPLGLSLVYRADALLERSGFPLVPYAKVGLICALWSSTDTGKSGAYAGRTLGWHAAAGMALALDFIDRESMRDMDQETGVNHVSLFAEATHAALDGLGAANVLHLGDTTWSGGIVFEF